MKIIFGPAKDLANQDKHGVLLAAAGLRDPERAFVIRDLRRIYGEDRFRAWGLIEGQLHM